MQIIFRKDWFDLFTRTHKVGTTIAIDSATNTSSGDKSLECSHEMISAITCNCFQVYGFIVKADKNSNVSLTWFVSSTEGYFYLQRICQIYSNMRKSFIYLHSRLWKIAHLLRERQDDHETGLHTNYENKLFESFVSKQLLHKQAIEREDEATE